MRNFTGGLISGAALLWVGAQIGAGTQDDVPDTVRARSLEIVDELGTTRLLLGVNEHGGAISVKDGMGRTVLLVGAGRDGGTVVLRDRDTLDPAVTMSAGDDGGQVRIQNSESGVSLLEVDAMGPRLSLGSVRGNPQVLLSAGGDRGGALSLHNALGERAVQAGVDDGGIGTLSTFGPLGNPTVRLASTAAAHGLIYTYDRQGHPLVRVTATEQNIGQIYTMNSAGQIQIALATQPHGPTLRLFNPGGAPAVTIEVDEQGRGEVSAWAPDGAGNTLRPPEQTDR